MKLCGSVAVELLSNKQLSVHILAWLRLVLLIDIETRAHTHTHEGAYTHTHEGAYTQTHEGVYTRTYTHEGAHTRIHLCDL